MHVKGFTALDERVPEEERGTFAGLAHAHVAEYLRRLGVTAAELLPVHAFLDDDYLVQKGLRNYWGYNTIGFFAPDPRYPPLALRQRVQGDGEPVPRPRAWR